MGHFATITWGSCRDASKSTKQARQATEVSQSRTLWPLIYAETQDSGASLAQLVAEEGAECWHGGRVCPAVTLASPNALLVEPTLHIAGTAQSMPADCQQKMGLLGALPLSVGCSVWCTGPAHGRTAWPEPAAAQPWAAAHAPGRTRLQGQHIDCQQVCAQQARCTEDVGSSQ